MRSEIEMWSVSGRHLKSFLESWPVPINPQQSKYPQNCLHFTRYYKIHWSVVSSCFALCLIQCSRKGKIRYQLLRCFWVAMLYLSPNCSNSYARLFSIRAFQWSWRIISLNTTFGFMAATSVHSPNVPCNAFIQSHSVCQAAQIHKDKRQPSRRVLMFSGGTTGLFKGKTHSSQKGWQPTVFTVLFLKYCEMHSMLQLHVWWEKSHICNPKSVG